jgi:hypothetical protein
MTDSLPNLPDLVQPNPPTPPIHDYNIAVIIDNTVYQVMNVDGQFAAQLLSQPTFVQVAHDQVKPGWLYDGSTQSFTEQEIL